MPIGTASNRLRKSIIFMLLKKQNLNFCFQCNSEIVFENELSIEHKVPYLDSENPIELFFDLNNIAFSHLKCNIGAAKKSWKITEGLDDIKLTHGSSGYDRGCKCNICKDAKKRENIRYRKK